MPITSRILGVIVKANWAFMSSHSITCKPLFMAMSVWIRGGFCVSAASVSVLLYVVTTEDQTHPETRISRRPNHLHWFRGSLDSLDPFYEQSFAEETQSCRCGQEESSGLGKSFIAYLRIGPYCLWIMLFQGDRDSKL